MTVNSLTETLIKHLPNHTTRTGIDEENPLRLNVSKISYELGITDKAIYKWLSIGFVPAGKIKKLIEIEGSTLTYEALSAHISN